MSRKILFVVLTGFAIAILVHQGCSSGGDGGDGTEAAALSFDGDTSLPAVGGAAIETSYGTGLGRVISAMLGALVADDASQPSDAAPKILTNVELPICDNPGGAILNGDLLTATATLTLEDCAGSPLSSRVVNGRIVIDVDTFGISDGVYNLSGTAELDGLTEEDSNALQIGDPETDTGGTRIEGGFAIQADVPVSGGSGGEGGSGGSGGSGETPAVTALSLTLGAETPDDRILVTEVIPGVVTAPIDGMWTGGRIISAELSCFEISMSLTADPPSIDSFSAEGVLNLGGRVYSMISEDIGFGDLSGVAAPISGSLTLTSGGTCGDFTVDGDGSSATATFAETVVDVEATGADGRVYQCPSELWINLLETLTDIAGFETCPCVRNCGTGGTGGAAGTGGTGGTAGSGGTAGTGGGVDECTFDTLDKQTCIEGDIYICTSTEGWQLFQDCPPGSVCNESPSGVFSCSTQ